MIPNQIGKILKVIQSHISQMLAWKVRPIDGDNRLNCINVPSFASKRVGICLGVVFAVFHAILGIPALMDCLTGNEQIAWGSISPQCYAQSVVSSKVWRRTNQGWELTRQWGADENAASHYRVRTSSASKWVYDLHRYVLPISITVFLTCLGSWCLISLPTQAVVVCRIPYEK